MESVEVWRCESFESIDAVESAETVESVQTCEGCGEDVLGRTSYKTRVDVVLTVFVL
jgi:hypothetical protein